MIYECFLKFKGSVSINANILFSTVEGDIGYAPQQTLPGDEVWVCENGRVLFILRETSVEGVFKVTGECYLHGVMVGELFEEGGLKYEVICLS